MKCTEVETRLTRAVLCVMGLLPNPDLNLETVIRTALDQIGLEEDQKDDVRVISRLVHESPKHYGAERTRAFWRIVSQHVPLGRLRAAYLNQFPNKLTAGKRTAVIRELKSRLGCDDVTAYDLFAKAGFIIVPNVCIRHYKTGGYCLLW